jgi:lipopolysaccharide/colanic/teichoic acid biosynthesis glycosyltransferase
LFVVGLTAPLWLGVLGGVALLVRLRLGTPILFRQPRAGRHGRPFRIVKFRSMTDARDASGALLSDAERLPAFGGWLRASSLDELPELLNVLRGEMSLVGPRPLHLHYVERYDAEQRRRLDARPGLTGLAQVSGRNALDWPSRFALDVEYVERCSLVLDLRILARTLGAVLRRDGIAAAGEATMPEFRGGGTSVAEHR